MDAMHVDSFAIGRKTIAITRGAIETFTAEELKGIFAHELGHMEYGHTKAMLLSNIGNVIFTLHILVIKGTLYVFQLLSDMTVKYGFIGKALSIMMLILRFLFDLSVLLFIHLSEAILALNSRSNVLQADAFAYEIGYGRGLKSELYLLQKISINTELKPLDRLKAPNPHIALRIAQLEGLEELENEGEEM